MYSQQQMLHSLTQTYQKSLTWTVAQWSKDLFSGRSKFSMLFEDQGPIIWKKSGEAQNVSQTD